MNKCSWIDTWLWTVFISQTQTYDLLNHLLKSLHACSCWAQTIWLSILDGVAKEWLSRTNNTSSPSHTQIHTDALLSSPLMPMGAQLLPGSYSLCLLPGTQLCALGLPCSVLEQKSWMSSDGPADGVVFFPPLTQQPEREGFSSPWACLCLHVFKQSSFDKFPPWQELFCSSVAEFLPGSMALRCRSCRCGIQSIGWPEANKILTQHSDSGLNFHFLHCWKVKS